MVDIDEALRESEERYRTLFEQAPVGVFLFDRSMRITECNLRFVDLVRSSYDRLIGLDIRRIRDQGVVPVIERALEGESTIFEGAYRTHHSNIELHVSMRLAPLRDADGNVVGGMGLVEDVTERMRKAAKLRTSEQRLSLHVRDSPLGVVVYDRKGLVVEWNDAATRIFGWTAEEMLGKHPLDTFVPPAQRAEIEAVARKLFTRSGGRRNTNPNVTKDGRIILCDWWNTPLVDDAGDVIGVAALVADVTERKESEAALRRSEARFRQVIEQVPELIAVTRERLVVYSNPALVRFLGYREAAELRDRPLASIAFVDDVARLLQFADEGHEHGSSLPSIESRLVRHDGTLVTCEVSAVRAEFDGQPSLILVARDVTERKEMQLRLLQADRMASVGTLAAGVAHEINNPLAYLMANLDVVTVRTLPKLLERLRDKDSSASPEEVLSQAIEMLEIAREGAARVRDIVRDLRTFSRADDEQRGPVDVRRVLDASVNMAWNEIRHRARLVKDYDEVPTVSVNESRLAQVFVNLLVNAAQSLPVGKAGEHEIRVFVGVDGRGRVRVEVSDTGPGIPEDIVARIFDPFFTTKPVGEGTGLGLWICQGIITSFGGEITVESRLGSGSTFSVALPADESPLTEYGPSSSPPSMTEASRGRVLVVDDDPAVGQALSRALENEHQIEHVVSARDALSRLRRGDGYDVVLCDLMMPDVTGMDLWETLRREAHPSVERFVFMTGGAFTPRAREFVDDVSRSGKVVLDKPFDLVAVGELVRRRVRANRRAS